MNTITIPQKLPLVPSDKGYAVVLMDEATEKRLGELIASAGTIKEVNADNKDAAEKILMQVHAAGKDLDKARKDAKAPFTAMGKAIDDAAKSLSIPLDDAKRAIQAATASYVREQQRIEAEARRRAAEEQARIEAEARAKREAEQAAAQAEADAEAAELAALLGEEVKAEVVEIAKPEPVAAPVVHIEETKSSALVMKKVKKLVITDATKIPAYVGGVEVRTINNAALKKALESGVTIEGAEIIEEEVAAMASQKGHPGW